jgi:hypothetical protein
MVYLLNEISTRLETAKVVVEQECKQILNISCSIAIHCNGSGFGVAVLVLPFSRFSHGMVQSEARDRRAGMGQMVEAIRTFFEQLGSTPSLQRIVVSMDWVAWILVLLLGGAALVGVYFSLTTRRVLLDSDQLEASPQLLLARLKQDPAQLSPVAILSRMGAEATLELLEYGDQLRAPEWRYKWGSVREELLFRLSQQNAFGPTHTLAHYYRSADKQEPDTLRIRRTALIHKLGQQRYVEPNSAGVATCLRVRAHPAEVQGDLGFDGETQWLLADEPAPAVTGPLVELDLIEFRTVQDASVRIHIRRSPAVGGGFCLTLHKRYGLWVVVQEVIEWVS